MFGTEMTVSPDRPVVEVSECYYGIGEVRDGKTYLVCLVTPTSPPRQEPKYRLILDVAVPVEGAMVVRTLREASLLNNGYPRRGGAPQRAVQISFDPDPRPPGSWRGRMDGNWPVRRVRIHRRSTWELLGSDWEP